MKYSKERQESVLKKMMPPHNKTIRELSREEGISEATLYNWRSSARQQGRLMPDGDTGPNGWSSKDRFAAVIETAAMNETELAEYCRQRGLYREQIADWRKACELANDWEQASSKALNQVVREERKKVKQLEQELNRKEKALAEAAALLVLRKKAQAIWGESEDE